VLQAGRIKVQIPVRATDFSLPPKRPDGFLDTPNFVFTGHPGFLHRDKAGRGVAQSLQIFAVLRCCAAQVFS
jgi:hypothetical protein